MLYTGTLDFEDGDRLIVSQLIVREGELAIEATATWEGGGLWKVSAIAPRDGNCYMSGLVTTKVDVKGGAASVCSLSFWNLEHDDDELTLSGCWREHHSDYPFSGTLKKKRVS